MKPSDKPHDRPTVTEVAERLRAYRALPGRYVGGCVHIVTDDPNYEQHHADWCLEHAEEWGRDWGDGGYLPEDLEIATLIAALTTTQRRKLAQLNTYPDMMRDYTPTSLSRSLSPTHSEAAQPSKASPEAHTPEDAN